MQQLPKDGARVLLHAGDITDGPTNWPNKPFKPAPGGESVYDLMKRVNSFYTPEMLKRINETAGQKKDPALKITSQRKNTGQFPRFTPEVREITMEVRDLPKNGFGYNYTYRNGNLLLVRG